MIHIWSPLPAKWDLIWLPTRWDGQLGNASFRTLFELEEQDLFKASLYFHSFLKQITFCIP